MGRNRDRVVIVGAGLTGLSAAHELITRSSRPIDVQVLEARPRAGGAIWTERRDGFILEGGADSFLTAKPWAVALCRRLGLTDSLIETDAANRRSFVVSHGRLVPVPEGFTLMAPGRIWPVLRTPLLSWRGKMRLLLDLVIPGNQDEADESLASFVRRRLGREALDRLVQPLVGGIYTADPTELSIRAALPQYAAMEREHGSLIRAARRNARPRESGARYGLFLGLREGMGQLIDALVGTLPAGTLRHGVSVRRIERPENRGAWQVEMLNEPAIPASAVLIATEAHAATRLLDGIDPALALGLRSIPYASSSIVQIAYRREQISHPLDGFGAVVPAIEGRRILAVSFTSVKFPGHAPAGTVLFRVFLGGATQPELFELDDAETIAVACEELGALLGAQGKPLLAAVARHPRAMPQYTVGHLDRIEAIRAQAARHAGLFLAGNYMTGVGVPDCIHAGQTAAAAILAALERTGTSVAA